MAESLSNGRTGWFSLDWDHWPLVTGNVDGGPHGGRHRFYEGSGHWRHAFAWARQYTDDVRIDFGGAYRLQVGGYRDQHTVLPDLPTLAVTDAAVHSLLSLRSQDSSQSADISLDVDEQSRSPVQLSVPAYEPHRLAGFWGTLLGNYYAKTAADQVALHADFDHRANFSLVFQAVAAGGDIPKVTARHNFRVAGLEDKAEELTRLGGRVTDESRTSMTISDPEGNALVLTGVSSNYR